jgi:LemA protein
MFRHLQQKTNEAASNIDVQLKKRRDTLIKMVDATQSAFNYERNLLMDVTHLRTANNFRPNKIEGAANSAKLDQIYSKMLATFENYPKLESIAAVRDMMQVADYTEREIAASRRLYNAAATTFNEEIYV